jgi:hypothetical protein
MLQEEDILQSAKSPELMQVEKKLKRIIRLLKQFIRKGYLVRTTASGQSLRLVWAILRWVFFKESIATCALASMIYEEIKGDPTDIQIQQYGLQELVKCRILTKVLEEQIEWYERVLESYYLKVYPNSLSDTQKAFFDAVSQLSQWQIKATRIARPQALIEAPPAYYPEQANRETQLKYAQLQNDLLSELPKFCQRLEGLLCQVLLEITEDFATSEQYRGFADRFERALLPLIDKQSLSIEGHCRSAGHSLDQRVMARR